MSASSEVVVFGLSRNVYTRIARLVLEEKCTDYRLEEVEIFGPDGVPGDHLLRHPFGRIPVLKHGAFVLYETAAITRYVDESFPGPALQPTELRARARMAQIINLLDAYAYRPMVWSVFVERVCVPAEGGRSDDAKVDRGLEQSRTCLKAMTSLYGGGLYLVGSHPTLADFHAYPLLRYLTLAPEGAALTSEFPDLSYWLEKMSARSSVVRTRSAYESSP